MKKKHLAFIMLIGFILFFSSCKRQEPFVDPAYIFLKWSGAVKTLNYKDYSECEAFPKDPDVFRNLYRDFYYGDLIIRDMSKFNESDVKSDFEGYKFNHRMLYFECKRISRETGKTVENMKGEVEFIKYIDGPRINRGWLMHNRTLIRTGFSE